MKILICNNDACCRNECEAVYKELMNYVEQDVHFLHSACMDLCEDGPNVLVLPETKFYFGVTKDKVDDLIHGRLEHQLHPKERLYDVSMERYREDPMHRRTVKLFRYQVEKMKDVNWRSARDALLLFRNKYGVTEEDLALPVKMALLGTTKGPELPKLMEMLGKEEVFQRIDQYLQDNKYRIL